MAAKIAAQLVNIVGCRVVPPFSIGSSDFRNYYAVRFFTGMRTGEIDGLKWKYLDFDCREILVRESVVKGVVGTTKTAESNRSIAMSRGDARSFGLIPGGRFTRVGRPGQAKGQVLVLPDRGPAENQP